MLRNPFGEGGKNGADGTVEKLIYFIFIFFIFLVIIIFFLLLLFIFIYLYYVYTYYILFIYYYIIIFYPKVPGTPPSFGTDIVLMYGVIPRITY